MLDYPSLWLDAEARYAQPSPSLWTSKTRPRSIGTPRRVTTQVRVNATIGAASICTDGSAAPTDLRARDRRADCASRHRGGVPLGAAIRGAGGDRAVLSTS